MLFSIEVMPIHKVNAARPFLYDIRSNLSDAITSHLLLLNISMGTECNCYSL